MSAKSLVLTDIMTALTQSFFIVSFRKSAIITCSFVKKINHGII
ncbi:hypothetical protein AEQU3_03110 [Aequorivita antarctica]|nr:hypothetical protein AEQU3_03110 [Aequorivita antarctica]